MDYVVRPLFGCRSSHPPIPVDFADHSSRYSRFSTRARQACQSARQRRPEYSAA